MARNLRLVHPFSPCVAVYSERPVLPTDHSRGRRPRSARNLRRFDPGSGSSALYLPERGHRRAHCQASRRGFRRSRLACSRRLVGAGERPLAPRPGRPKHVQPHRRHSRAAAGRRHDSCWRPRRHQSFRRQGFTGHDDPAVADRPARPTRGSWPSTHRWAKANGRARAYRSDAARRRAAAIRARHIRQFTAPPRPQVVPNRGRPETL